MKNQLARKLNINLIDGSKKGPEFDAAIYSTLILCKKLWQFDII